MTPLARRLPRELRHNIGKYLGIFLLMCGSIALTSGFLLAAHSIGCIIDGMRNEYTIEDGRVTTSFEATDAQLEAAEGATEGVGGVTLHKNFSIDAAIKKPTGDDGTKRTLRTYAHRTEVDTASYCEGTKPQADNEVAVDRVFATNNGLAVGDKVELCGRAYTICGIMTLPDSQALFPNNSDFTVNTITFGVAEVTDAGFAALEDAGGAPAYTYSFTFNDRDLSVAERTDAEKDMVEALTDADARVDDLIDADSNQGIGYARDDVDGDSAMWTTLLDIIIVIMAFVFVVLTDATIEEESAVIGTLLASGYRKREIILHYLALPAIVGILAAGLGCTLGVAFFTEPMRNLYYGSYSLPPFRVYWSWEIFIKCAIAVSYTHLDVYKRQLLHYFIRLRTGNGKPIAISYNYVSAKIVPAIDVKCLEQSFYAFLDSQGIEREYQGTSYTAKLPTAEQQELLEANDIALLCASHSTFTRREGKLVPFGYTLTCYNGNLYTYYSSI